MKITNHAGLPQPFVDAVTPRKPAPDVIRVTELIGPPLIRRLLAKHWDALEDDAADRIWAVFGQSVHAILEAASTPGLHLVEQELSMDFTGMEPYEGITLKGRPDVVALAGEKLIDYKVTSVWSVLLGDRKEWSAQLNVYAYLLRLSGVAISAIENVCILRDWSRREAQRSADYPRTAVVTLAHVVWSDQECLDYILTRLDAHLEQDPGPCTPEERWERPTTYAVMKPGAKRAIRVLPSQEAAEAFIAATPALAKAEAVKRPGASVRCQDYCPVRAVCPWRATFVAPTEQEEV